MLVPEITYTVSGGTLNLSHLLTHYVSIDRITRRVRLSVRLSPLASSDKNKKKQKKYNLDQRFTLLRTAVYGCIALKSTCQCHRRQN